MNAVLKLTKKDEETIRWMIELRLQSKYHERMKEYYLNKAVEAVKRGDNAAAKLYEEQAVANEKSRILTLKNLHRVEQARDEHKLAKNMKRTALVMKKVQKKLNREKVRKTIVKAVTVMARIGEEDRVITEAMDLAMQGEISPNEARRIVHKEFEAKLGEELKPAIEVERLREEIKREAEEEEA